MVPGWSALSSGVHASEDALAEKQRMWCDPSEKTVADPAPHSWIRRAAAGESVCHCEGDRGRCRRAGNVRDDTRAAAHAGRSRLTVALWIFNTAAGVALFKGVIRATQLLSAVRTLHDGVPSHPHSPS